MFFYILNNINAIITPTILPANASDGRCPRDSLNFFSQSAWFIAEACRPASKRTLIASYIIKPVKAMASAKISDVTPCFNAIAVVSETTTHECTDGIHPLQKACHILTLPVFALIDIPLINTVTKNVITGIKSKLV
jgi:hypothetical protein